MRSTIDGSAAVWHATRVQALGRWVSGLFLAVAGLSGVLTLGTIAHWMSSGSMGSVALPVIPTLGLVLEAVGAAVFVVWLHRAVTNLRRRGAYDLWAPALALLAWLLPLGGVLLGVMILRVWKASDPELPVPIDRSWRTHGDRSNLGMAWAVCFTLSGLAAGFGSLVCGSAGFDSMHGLWVLTDGLRCVAAVQGAMFVRRLSARHAVLA